MLFILFCNFLLVLDGSGPPREINSSFSFDSARAAGAGGAGGAGGCPAGQPRAGPGSGAQSCPRPLPGQCLLLHVFRQGGLLSSHPGRQMQGSPNAPRFHRLRPESSEEAG